MWQHFLDFSADRLTEELSHLPKSACAAIFTETLKITQLVLVSEISPAQGLESLTS